MKFYNNNPLLPAANQKIPITKNEFMEVYKCSNNREYFLNTYLKLNTLDHGFVNVKLYEYQERFLKSITNNRFNIGMMPRQMGKSAMLAGYSLYDLVFESSYTVGILAHKMDLAVDILDKVKDAFMGLPLFLKRGVQEWNKRSILLDNGSNAFAAPTTLDSIRGQAINFLILDEFAFVDDGEEFLGACYPVISTGTRSKICIISTPKGDNAFKQTWYDALNGLNEYVPFRAFWKEHPQRDEKWKEETIKNIGLRRFRREFECEFDGSSGTLIEGEYFPLLKEIDPINNDEKVKIFEKPLEGHVYFLIADVSEGIGQDSSTFVIFDVTDLKHINVVATFKDEFKVPEDYNSIINEYGLMYNEAFVIVENNSIGRIVAGNLYYNNEYPEMLFSTQRDNRIIFAFNNNNYGIRSTRNVKLLGGSTLKTLVEGEKLKLNDKRIINELKTFIVTDDGKLCAEAGKHDDMITPLWLLGFLINEQWILDYIESRIF